MVSSKEKIPDEIKQYLTKDQLKLYQLIWNRFLASQMADAVFDTQTVDILAENSEKFLFRASGQVIKFDGFLKLFKLSEEKNENEGKTN